MDIVRSSRIPYINIAIVAAILATAGCATKQPSVVSAPVTHTNPSTFPLYQPNAIVDVASFDQREMAQAINSHVTSGDHKVTPYKGNEVIASTSSSLADLKSWLDGLKKAPPAGMKVTADIREASSSQELKTLNSWGANAAGFSGPGGREVMVMVMDPKKVSDQIGPALDLISKYQALPAMIRTPIDQKAKQQFGVSVSEMLDKSSPIGVFVSAVEDLKTSGRRAIVLLDATKE